MVCRTLIIRLTVLLVGLLTAPGVGAQDLLPGDDDVVVWEWDFREDDLLGWTAMHNLTPLRVAGGVLRTRATGDDAYLGVAGLKVDADAITHAVIRMRADQPGGCQIYFSTSEGPDPARNAVPTFFCPGDNQFREFEVRLGGQQGWAGWLHLFRLDPVNGQGISAHIEVDWIRLLRKAPRLEVLRFAPDGCWVAPRYVVVLTLTVAEAGGSPLPSLEAVVEIPPGARLVDPPNPVQTLRVQGSGGPYRASWKVWLPEPGAQTCKAQVRCGDRVLASLETPVLVAERAKLPDPSGRLRAARIPMGVVLENEHLSLLLFQSEEGIAAGLLRVRRPGSTTWPAVGVCLPLAQVAVQTGRQQAWWTPAFEEVQVRKGALALSHRLPGSLGRLALSFELARGANMVQVRAHLEPKSNAGLVRFAGPTLRAGEGTYGFDKEAALFPGIEFLEGYQRSSNTDVVGDGVGYRPSPAPYQITVPLMAVCSEGLLCGLMWDALGCWDGEQALPMAEFASPNFLDGQKNHLMALFVPNSPHWTAPNRRAAEKPYPLQPGRPLILESRLFTLAGSDIAQAVPLWYRTYGVPPPPAPAKPLAAFLNDLMQGWGQTCYVPEQDGFVNHWRTGETPHPSPGLRARLLAHYLETGEARWITRCGIAPGTTLLDLLGSLFPAFDAGDPPACIASQREDGSWGYTCPPDVRRRCEEFTQGARHSLGAEGATNVGLCAAQAVGILAHALRTGHPESERAGLKALEAMMRFKVPAGSQTWEVHLDIPDIYAAALATDCFRMGYELTGEPRYLDRAVYWARTGLPFLYAYQVPGTGPGATCNVPGDPLTEGDDPFQGTHPAAEVYRNADRQVTPYGSIPVFGTSFFVVSWFGNLVQWCGLVWAHSVYALLQHVEDPVLEAAARGVTISGCQQTFDREPLVGLLPDTWHLGSNTIYPAFIAPGRLEPPLRWALDRPAADEVKVRIVRAGDRRIHVNSRGAINDASLAGRRLRWIERYPAGQICDSVLIGLPEPRAATVGGRLLGRVLDVAQVEQGWQYLPESRRLLLRVRHAEERVEVVVRW